MNLFIENTQNLFFEKSASNLLEYIKDIYDKKVLHDKVADWSNTFYNDNFYHFNLSEEFDFKALNIYLQKNNYERITACFNAHEHIHRMILKDQLYIQAYSIANANTRQKKNGVCIYIDNLMNIFKEHFIDKNNKILIKLTLDNALKEIDKMLDEQTDKLINYIDYHNSFAEYVDNIKYNLYFENKYKYLNNAILLQGREDALTYIDDFLNAAGDILFTAITGPGGVGKSKLLHHYIIRETYNKEWKIIFPKSDVFEKIVNNYTKWKYPKNLLIIIDYAGESIELIHKWLVLLHSSERLLPPKIRVILLERQGINDKDNTRNINPLWYQILNSRIKF